MRIVSSGLMIQVIQVHLPLKKSCTLGTLVLQVFSLELWMIQVCRLTQPSNCSHNDKEQHSSIYSTSTMFALLVICKLTVKYHYKYLMKVMGRLDKRRGK